MTLDRFSDRVRSAEELRTIIGTPSAFSLKKELRALDEHMRRFVTHSPFVVISTHSADGRCDASPRGDAAGFIHVLDDRTLLIPERPGNRRVDTLRNILETGRIGLLCLVPGFGETLRVNGRAAIIRDEAWLTPLSVQGKRPLVAVAIAVEEFLAVREVALEIEVAGPAREAGFARPALRGRDVQRPRADAGIRCSQDSGPARRGLQEQVVLIHIRRAAALKNWHFQPSGLPGVPMQIQ